MIILIVKLLRYFAYCSRVTRSLTAAKKHRRASSTSSTSLALHRAPYWMRYPRTATADTASSSNSSVVTANSGVPGSIEQETVIGSTGDGFQPTASTSHSHDCGTELSASCLHAPKMQMSASHCFCSQSSRLESCVKSAKPVCCEASGRLLQSNSVEGHSAASLAPGENVHQRLYCGHGEYRPCTSHTDDNTGVLFASADCQHSAMRMSSTTTHVDRPWVSVFALLVELCYLCL